MANRVYPGSFYYIILPLAGQSTIFQIQSENRELKLKSILWDWKLYNFTTGNMVPIEQNSKQSILLQIGDIDTVIGSPFNYVSGSPILNNGKNIEITLPGQYFFDSFFIKNSITFSIAATNQDAANTFIHKGCLIVETEENIIYQ